VAAHEEEVMKDEKEIARCTIVLTTRAKFRGFKEKILPLLQKSEIDYHMEYLSEIPDFLAKKIKREFGVEDSAKESGDDTSSHLNSRSASNRWAMNDGFIIGTRGDGGRKAMNIIRRYNPQKSFSRKTFSEDLEAVGLTPTSVNDYLTKAVRMRLIRRVDQGVYKRIDQETTEETSWQEQKNIQ
jgi:hypothetical protein